MSGTPDRNELEAFLADALERHAVPGAAATLSHAGRDQTATLGLTSREDPLPVTPTTLFRWGSITKTLTCLAVLRLMERGTIGLDEPVRAHLPGLRLADEAAARAVTMRHLLTHSGGWYDDPLPDTGPGDDALSRALEGIAERPQMMSPGRLSSYGDSYFTVAGRVVEVATGLTFEAAARELVLEPLGMTSSVFDLAEVVCRRTATGHQRTEGGDRVEAVRPWPYQRNRAPASGLVGSLVDLVRYARFAMGDGRNEAGAVVLSAETMGLMRTPHLVGAFDHWRGLSWNVRDLGGVRFVGHGGASPGFHVQMLVAPDHDFLLCALTNSSDGLGLVTELVDWARTRCLGVVKRPSEPLDLPREQLEQYAGRYVDAMGKWWVDVSVEGSRLRVQFADHERNLDTVVCGVCSGDTFVTLDGRARGLRGEYLRDDEGVVRWIRVIGRISMQREA